MQQLEPRDRIALMCAGLVVLLVLFMAFYLPSGPLKQYRQSQTELADKQEELQMLEQLKLEELARLESQEEFQQRLASRPQSFDFMGFMQEVLRETNLMGRAELSSSRSRASSSTQPMVELELTGVTLEELVSLLHRVYGSGNLVAVYEIDHIRPAKDQQGLDLSMTLVTVKA